MAAHDVDIDSLFEPGAEGALDAYVRLLHPADLALLFDYVEPEHWGAITQRLSPETLGEVLANSDERLRGLLGGSLHIDHLAAAVDQLETDDAADVLSDFSEERTQTLLRTLPQEDRHELTTLMAYPSDSAGGIMQTELCKVEQGTTIARAIDAVRAARDQELDMLDIYVVDARGLLVGLIELADLVLGQPSDSIDRYTVGTEYAVQPDVDQELVAQLFRKYDIAAVPVVDARGALLGRITFDDIHDVLEEEASEDIMTMAGASPEELVYSGRSLRVVMLRLPWLMTSLLGALISGYLLSLLAHVRQDAILLASFVPVISAMSGNVGSQSAMIVMRGLAIGRMELSGMRPTFWREFRVGFLMGVVAALCAGTVAYLWRGQLMLGVCVSVSMLYAMMIATSVGVAAPALFKRIGVDPAIAAGPLVTTSCDILGVSTYLGVVVMLLR